MRRTFTLMRPTLPPHATLSLLGKIGGRGSGITGTTAAVFAAERIWLDDPLRRIVFVLSFLTQGLALPKILLLNSASFFSVALLLSQ